MKLVFRCVTAALALSITVHSAIAQSPYESEVRGDTQVVLSLSEQLHDGVERRSTPYRFDHQIRLSFNAQGLGRYDLVLNNINYKDWDSFIIGERGHERDRQDVILVDGFIKDRGSKRLPVGGSLYRSKGKAKLFLVVDGKRRKKRSGFVRVNLDRAGNVLFAKISSMPKGITSKGCSTDPAYHSLRAGFARASAGIGTRGVTTGTAKIATAADPQYYSTYGSDTNAHIATIVSAASAIYNNQMGIRLSVSAQHAFSSGGPYTASDAGALLTQFQNYTNTNMYLGAGDAYHLFSGKNLDGSTIGLAYVGVVCLYPDYAFGLTQRYHPSADASIFAHELGHNFGAPHDNSNTIMAPYISVPGSTTFSGASMAAIRDHLLESPACLSSTTNDDPTNGSPTDPTDPGPSYPTTRLQALVHARGVLSLRINVSEIEAGCSINLFGSVRRSGERTLLTSFTPTELTTRYRLRGVPDPRDQRLARSRLFFFSQYVCPGSSDDSSKQVNLNGITRKTSLSSRRILELIAEAFAASSSRVR